MSPPVASLAVLMRLLLRKHNKLHKIPADLGADKGSAHLKALVQQCACT